MTEKLVRLVTETYRDVKTVVRTAGGVSREFEIKVGLHQGSTLSPLLFAVIIDVLSEHLRAENLWELLFADDLVIMADSEEQLQERLVKWQKSLEQFGLKMNAKKTKTMVCCKKGGAKVVVWERNGEELNQVESFRYLGSVICESAGCEKDVQARVSASWMKWKEVSVVMNDRRMPMRLKVVYRTVVRLVMIYGLECWMLKKKDERRLETMEMKMLRRMLGVTLKDRMRNEDVRSRTTVTSSVVSVIEVNKLRWYGHLLRKTGLGGASERGEEQMTSVKEVE